jgi:CspA family cold shock protein
MADITKTGRVTRIITDRGFAFLRCDGERGDYFLHHSELQGRSFQDLEEGDVVTFVPQDQNDRGPRASHAQWIGR